LAKCKYILGISCYYHDSAACLVKDGEAVAASEEERFSRIKHDNGFPERSIAFCLSHAGIDIGDVSIVAFYEKPIPKLDRVLTSFSRTYPWSMHQFCKALPSWLNEKLRIRETIRKKTGFGGEIMFLPHHLSHAASAFYPSGLARSAILTVDGVGEWATASYGVGEGRKVRLLKQMEFPDSVGLIYSTITSYLGFDVNNDEYKVMGLAPYGTPRFEKEFSEFVELRVDGTIRLDMSYFGFEASGRMYGKKMVSLLGAPRTRGGPISRRHKDIASTMQKMTEDIILKMAMHVKRETKERHLCLAGGVALNSAANGRLVRESGFDSIWIQPAAGDSGGALGAALYAYHHISPRSRPSKMEDAYLGECFSDGQIRSYLDCAGIRNTRLDEEKTIGRVAGLLKKGRVVGWFHGRSEFGPRALGNRSILANPCIKTMKDVINRKVKFREPFRPFAPAVPLEDAGRFFEIEGESPFMLKLFNVRLEKRDAIPAVTHVDGTARVQTVTEKQNRLFYRLLKRFGELSGVPVLLNTSFNVKGEPIVNSPEEAYRCFLGTGIDCLVIGSYLIEKNK
jgi:carbamoyltransferase